MENEWVYFSTSNTRPGPWDALTSPKPRSNLVTEWCFHMMEIGVSVDQPVPVGWTSPKGRNAHIIICSNNELSILDYLPSAYVTFERKNKEKEWKPHLISPKGLEYALLNVIQASFCLSKVFQRPKTILAAVHSSLVCDWSCCFLLCLFAWI